MATKKKRRSKKLSSRKTGQSTETPLNLFEVRVNRKKHDILGQRLKSDRGLPGISRSKAIQKRKKTLLQEYKKRSKSNLFVDHRFSEHDGETAERLMRRFMEKKRKQADVFALEADEQDLTHRGKSVRDMENFDDIDITDDEVEQAADFDGEANFGGFLTRKVPKSAHHTNEAEEEEPQKTRKQILEEVVSKSKLMKYERQSEKQEVEELLDRVDTDLKHIWGALAKSQPKRTIQETPDDYDRAVRELVFERRGQPTNRMQTEKEAMEEENTKLQRFMAEREQKMKRLPTKDSSVETSADYMPDVVKERKVHFMLEDQDTLEEDTTNAMDRVDSEDDVECDDQEESSEDHSSDSDTSDTSDTGDSNDDSMIVQCGSSELITSSDPSQTGDLNIDHLFRQFIELGQHPSFKLSSLDQVARSIFQQCHVDSLHAGKFFKDIVCKYHREWIATKRRPGYPSLAQLLVFKLIGAVFPTSDFQHPVVSPAMVLMVQLLQKCEVKTRRDMVCGLYVCDVLIEYIAKSRRYIPELVNYLTSCSGCFCSGEGVVYPPFTLKSCPLLEIKSDPSKGTNVDNLPSLTQLVSSLSTPECSLSSSLINITILKHTIVLGTKLVRLYSDLPSFMEVFSSLHLNLIKINERSIPMELQNLLEAVNKEMLSVSTTPRRALYLKQKPKSISFYNPKIDVVYDDRRRGGGTKASRGRQKLKYKVKKEQKGALREIRKDNSFLAKEKLKEALQRDAERARKTKQILSDLQTIQHEAKLTKVKR